MNLFVCHMTWALRVGRQAFSILLVSRTQSVTLSDFSVMKTTLSGYPTTEVIWRPKVVTKTV